MPPPKQCVACDRWFTSKSNLNRHNKQFHTILNLDAESCNDNQPESDELNYANDQDGFGLLDKVLTAYEHLTERYNKLCNEVKRKPHSLKCKRITTKAIRDRIVRSRR